MQARTRTAAAVILTFGALSLSACGWMGGKKNDVYKMSAESRPLEVPPDLDRPSADAAMNIPSGGASATASQVQQRVGSAAPATASSGFLVPGTRDAAYEKLGTALAGVSGVTINNKSQMLGTYDVTFSGRQFLIRAAAVDGGVHVAAIDPRGSADNSAEAKQVMVALKAAMLH